MDCPENTNRRPDSATYNRDRETDRRARVAQIEELYGEAQSNSAKLDKQLDDQPDDSGN